VTEEEEEEETEQKHQEHHKNRKDTMLNATASASASAGQRAAAGAVPRRAIVAIPASKGARSIHNNGSNVAAAAAAAAPAPASAPPTVAPGQAKSCADRVRLGRSDLLCSAITLGTMTWGKQNTEAEAHEQLSYAIDE
jgi:hypothetical protein